MGQFGRETHRRPSGREPGLGLCRGSCLGMVDQATVKSTNGRAESPPHAVVRSASEFVHDVLTLAELQGKLFMVDFQDGLKKLIWPAIGLAVGGVLALCCVPLALTTIALAIEELTTLSFAQSFGIV